MNKILEIDGHSYEYSEPSLNSIEQAVLIAKIGPKGETAASQDDILEAMSVILVGDNSLVKELKLDNAKEVAEAFGNKLFNEIGKIQLTYSYIEAISNIAARKD